LPLLLRIPDTEHLDRAQVNPKRLLDRQLKDVGLSRAKSERALDPELRLIIQSESSLMLITPDEEEIALQVDDVVALDAHVVGGIVPHHGRLRRLHTQLSQPFLDPLVCQGRGAAHWNNT